MPDKLRARALAVLREGRCRIVKRNAATVEAHVTSSRDPQRLYVVDGPVVGLDYDDWHCTCRPGFNGEPCPHVAAVQLVTIGRIA